MFCCYLIVFKVCVRFVIFKLSNFTETGADDQVYDSLIHTQSKIFIRNKQLPEITVFGWFFAASMLTFTGLYKHDKTIVLIVQFDIFIRCYLLITENSSVNCADPYNSMTNSSPWLTFSKFHSYKVRMNASQCLTTSLNLGVKIIKS